jgi:hypothetical protein
MVASSNQTFNINNGEVNNQTSITLIGKYKVGYGNILQQNVIDLLSHSATKTYSNLETCPAIVGQLIYTRDPDPALYLCYDETSPKKFKKLMLMDDAFQEPLITFSLRLNSPTVGSTIDVIDIVKNQHVQNTTLSYHWYDKNTFQPITTTNIPSYRITAADLNTTIACTIVYIDNNGFEYEFSHTNDITVTPISNSTLEVVSNNVTYDIRNHLINGSLTIKLINDNFFSTNVRDYVNLDLFTLPIGQSISISSDYSVATINIRNYPAVTGVVSILAHPMKSIVSKNSIDYSTIVGNANIINIVPSTVAPTYHTKIDNTTGLAAYKNAIVSITHCDATNWSKTSTSFEYCWLADTTPIGYNSYIEITPDITKRYNGNTLSVVMISKSEFCNIETTTYFPIINQSMPPVYTAAEDTYNNCWLNSNHHVAIIDTSELSIASCTLIGWNATSTDFTYYWQVVNEDSTISSFQTLNLLPVGYTNSSTITPINLNSLPDGVLIRCLVVKNDGSSATSNTIKYTKQPIATMTLSSNSVAMCQVNNICIFDGQLRVTLNNDTFNSITNPRLLKLVDITDVNTECNVSFDAFNEYGWIDKNISTTANELKYFINGYSDHTPVFFNTKPLLNTPTSYLYSSNLYKYEYYDRIPFVSQYGDIIENEPANILVATTYVDGIVTIDGDPKHQSILSIIDCPLTDWSATSDQFRYIWYIFKDNKVYPLSKYCSTPYDGINQMDNTSPTFSLYDNFGILNSAVKIGCTVVGIDGSWCDAYPVTAIGVNGEIEIVKNTLTSMASNIPGTAGNIIPVGYTVITGILRIRLVSDYWDPDASLKAIIDRLLPASHFVFNWVMVDCIVTVYSSGQYVTEFNGYDNIGSMQDTYDEIELSITTFTKTSNVPVLAFKNVEVIANLTRPNTENHYYTDDIITIGTSKTYNIR